MASSSKKQSHKKNTVRHDELTEYQKMNVKETFKLFDLDGTGKIATRDLTHALNALGFEPTRKEIQALLTDVTPQCPNELSYEEFAKIMSVKMNEVSPEEEDQKEMLRAFQLFDDDRTGKISFQNLKRVMVELEEDMDDEEIRDMIEMIDEDGDGEISLEEFMKLFKNMSC